MHGPYNVKLASVVPYAQSFRYVGLFPIGSRTAGFLLPFIQLCNWIDFVTLTIVDWIAISDKSC